MTTEHEFSVPGDFEAYLDEHDVKKQELTEKIGKERRQEQGAKNEGTRHVKIGHRRIFLMRSLSLNGCASFARATRAKERSHRFLRVLGRTEC